jgi:hypothetical protein
VLVKIMVEVVAAPVELQQQQQDRLLPVHPA